MTVFLVSHFHWDREWYRTMQAFRARLVDAIDMVLDLAREDSGYRFLLDGQTVVLEDYLVVRPDREAELRERIGNGQLGIGPWYVQPDSLLPSGEAHVRNLLAGRRVGEAFGPVSSVAYVPDSFGHPSQFPMLFEGFGLDGFVHWRGNGSELDELRARWRWNAPSGDSVRVLLLSEGYFGASRLDDAGEALVDRLSATVEKQRSAGENPCVLMNGFDHTRPDATTGAAARALSDHLGEEVERVLLDDVVRASPTDQLPEYSGELVGGRIANLLPGVWSARMPIKVRNRRLESLLSAWAEPWAALGHVLGLPDERPSLHYAWKLLLQNQAHDSICGCSIDAVHERMEARYDDAEGLAEETLARCLEHLAGRARERSTEWTDVQSVTVFNPSPHTRTDRVRIAADGDPVIRMSVGDLTMHPWSVGAAWQENGYTVDGAPAWVVDSPDAERVRWVPAQRAITLEFIARDVPAYGCRTYEVAKTEPDPPEVDVGRSIRAGDLTVEVADDATISLSCGERQFAGLFAVEDIGDRGDSYDFDPIGETLLLQPGAVSVERQRHTCGIERLIVKSSYELPQHLDAEREGRSSETVECGLEVVLTVAADVPRVDATVRFDNRASDHRLRLLFPSGTSTDDFEAATTFDVAQRSTAPDDGTGWVHVPPRTFCHQGDIAVNGLSLCAPGLPEAEVTPDGVIALTLVRSVGWLSRQDLRTRPLPAGPMMETPGAQVLGEVVADLSFAVAPSRRAVCDAVVGLRGVVAGPQPKLSDGQSLIEIEGDDVVLSACKPAEDGDALIVRLLNEGASEGSAVVRFGFPVRTVELARLDETPLGQHVSGGESGYKVTVGAHSAATLRVISGQG